MNRRLSLWLVALALVAAQTLGLLHRVVHTPQALASAVQSVEVPGETRGWAQEFFAGHNGEPSCRLFDELNASGVLPDVAAVALPPVLPLYFFAWFQGEALARQATLYDARGPPALR